jgi:hypothetical protein
MITTTAAIKSYFLVIVALASVAGSAVAAPYISNVINVGSSSNGSDPSSLIPNASAQAVPFRVDHHLKIKEKAGDPLRIEENINDAERHCEMNCKYIEYKPGSRGRAGLAFITDTPVDLSGAKKVHFFLMGDKGGETVKVKIAGKNAQSDNVNVPRGPPNAPRGLSQNLTTGPPQGVDDLFKEKFALSTDIITLPNDWQRYEVPLDGIDLKNVVAPFGIELLKGKGSAPQVVYLKYIVYGDEPVDERFLLPANATTTTANTTGVESNNTLSPGEENTEENNSTSNTTTGVDSLEVENDISDNNDNETVPTSTINNSTTEATLPPGDQTSNTTDIAPAQGQDVGNLAPVAMPSVDNLVARPGDRVILDGSPSRDPEGDIITYQWSQSDGPNAELVDGDTATPTVIIPTIDQNDQITIDLVVSDGQVESNKVPVVIDVQYTEEMEDPIEHDLLPDDSTIRGEGWSSTECGGNDDGGALVECLIDGSDSTFVSSDAPGEVADILFTFEDPSTVGINGSNQIEYVTAQLTAKKTGPSGFSSLIVDDPNSDEHYSTSGISIVSNSFEQYSFTWNNNPVTGEPWTLDSLNSFMAGYRHMAGQGSIEISEFKLIVGSLVPEVEQEPPPPPPPPSQPSSTVDEEASPAEEPEVAAEGSDNGESDNDDEGASPADTPSEESDSNDPGEAESNTSDNTEPIPTNGDIETDEAEPEQNEE